MYHGIYSFQGFIFLLPAILFAFYAQARVKMTFNKYIRVGNTRGLTGSQVARYILDRNGLFDIEVEHIGGYLTDHYDPRNRVLRLSSNVYSGTSIAAISVAAHEAGHALQHAKGYTPLVIRNQIVPVVSFASQLVWPLVFVGLILGNGWLIDVGILFYVGAVLFQIITLPVEYNASSRALNQLVDSGLIVDSEIKYSKDVLNAAALTYVAAAAVSIAQLFRLLLIRNSSRD
ncbi:hypothetical protein SAMN02745883_00212 [Caminicella sporogenes DSM 14501]|uniref:Zn-dependent protease n=1 Tax=Caminicella sporogenes DSM 14501 TaxID=1121266 RepID=A0A1M6LHT0_9FIRM|nr:zinc metallopeptidase [Caminicella sporogenes]SHJ70734.1 hypothetical protein SAMN02745883_00212 [Caminicella sporogenes DSM 14501]